MVLRLVAEVRASRELLLVIAELTKHRTSENAYTILARIRERIAKAAPAGELSAP